MSGPFIPGPAERGATCRAAAAEAWSLVTPQRHSATSAGTRRPQLGHFQRDVLMDSGLKIHRGIREAACQVNRDAGVVLDDSRAFTIDGGSGRVERKQVILCARGKALGTRAPAG